MALEVAAAKTKSPTAFAVSQQRGHPGLLVSFYNNRMSSTTLEPTPVRDVMPAGARPTAEIAAGPAFELLIGLFALTNEPRSERSWPPRSLDACSSRVRTAVERIGPRSGELWLHLLGAVDSLCHIFKRHGGAAS